MARHEGRRVAGLDCKGVDTGEERSTDDSANEWVRLCELTISSAAHAAKGRAAEKRPRICGVLALHGELDGAAEGHLTGKEGRRGNARKVAGLHGTKATTERRGFTVFNSA